MEDVAEGGHWSTPMPAENLYLLVPETRPFAKKVKPEVQVEAIESADAARHRHRSAAPSDLPQAPGGEEGRCPGRGRGRPARDPGVRPGHPARTVADPWAGQPHVLGRLQDRHPGHAQAADREDAGEEGEGCGQAEPGDQGGRQDPGGRGRGRTRRPGVAADPEAGAQVRPGAVVPPQGGRDAGRDGLRGGRGPAGPGGRVRAHRVHPRLQPDSTDGRAGQGVDRTSATP